MRTAHTNSVMPKLLFGAGVLLVVSGDRSVINGLVIIFYTR